MEVLLSMIRERNDLCKLLEDKDFPEGLIQTQIDVLSLQIYNLSNALGINDQSTSGGTSTT